MVLTLLFREYCSLCHAMRDALAPFQAACQTILHHLADIHAFYGATAGARIARKHIGWYLQRLPDSADFRRRINQINEAAAQYEALAQYLHTQAQRHEYWFRDYG